MQIKADWLYRQSAAIPILDGKVVLVTTRSGKEWTVPKGVIERAMTPWDSAAKEAHEEAGVLGTIEPVEIGRYSYAKWGGECMVQVYRLSVETLLEVWDEQQRTRTLFALAEVADLPMHPALSQLIHKVLNERRPV
jgi:8-oxo-dGTP pyrophosphatase MutT (NUDIX family)